MSRDIKIALEAQKKLLLRLADHPEDFGKLPKRRLSLPPEHIILPYKKMKEVGDFYIIPKKYVAGKLKKNNFSRK